jgi:hypothetical protein
MRFKIHLLFLIFKASEDQLTAFLHDLVLDWKGTVRYCKILKKGTRSLGYADYPIIRDQLRIFFKSRVAYFVDDVDDSSNCKSFRISNILFDVRITTKLY